VKALREEAGQAEVALENLGQELARRVSRPA
jgi:hypothetical protein